MTKDERDALRKLCDAATPGPWAVSSAVNPLCSTGQNIGGDNGNVCWSYGKRDADCVANAELIAASRDALPQLLDALDAADAENSALKRDAERWREVERRTMYWYDSYWIVNAGCTGGFTKSIDAAIAERKRKDAT